MSIWKSSRNIGGAVHVRGLDELQRNLDQLTVTLESKIMRGALRAGASVLAAEARRLCPVSSGQLRESIRVSVRPQGGRWIVATVKAGGRFKVYRAGKPIKGAPYRTVRSGGGGVDYHAPFYAHFVEFGTGQHWIRPKNRKSLFVAGLFREAIDHPGARPRPFMRPAFDTKAQAAIEAMADYIRKRLAKEMARGGSQS